MRIYGAFKDLHDAHSYGVEIGKAATGGTGEPGVYEVDGAAGSDGVHVLWGTHAVTLETKCDDVDTVIVESRATVNVVTDGYLGGLYASDARDMPVKVTCDGGVVFTGYVEPRAYSQPWADESNSLSIHCIDGLAAMKYRKYRGVETRGGYEETMRAAGMRRMDAMLLECIASGCGDMPVFYDGSRRTADGGLLLLHELMVSESMYLGSSADDVKTCYEVVEDLLKYLGLHVMTYCGAVYIYSLESLGKEITWQQIGGADDGSGASALWQGGSLEAHAGGTDASIDVGEVYNQVSLTVSPKNSETVVRSPLDGSGTVPSRGGRVSYVTMYAADGDGERASAAFYSLVANHKDDGYGGEMVWKVYLVRPMRNIYWKTGSGSGPGSEATDWGTSLKDGAEALCDRLGSGLGCQLVGVGTVDHKPGTGDTGKQATVSMSTQMVFGVNGNGDDANPSPTEADVRSKIPVASYTGGESSTVYSPSDPGVKNYLVFSGTLVMTPLMKTKFKVEEVRSFSDASHFWSLYGKTFQGSDNLTPAKAYVTSPSRTNGDGRYLAFEWLKDGTVVKPTAAGWLPFTGDGPEQYEYRTPGDQDTADKVDVLWCMLRIGDKVLVEDKTKTGGLDAFTWSKYKTLAACGNDADEYLKQTFTIGIDPKIGDKLIGTEYSIGTNFDYTTNINADGGMAIPLPYSEHLHGKLRLDILGIDTGPWSSYHKTRSATMFRHTKWGTYTVPLMAHVGSVVLSGLSVKFYSDGTDNGEDSDIVYVSRASSGYINTKEQTGAMVHSGFTSSEVNAYNLNNRRLPSTVCQSNGEALLKVTDYNRGVTDKPERLYVNALWEWLHKPRVRMSATVTPVLPSPWAKYTCAGKSLVPLSMKNDLSEDTCKATMIEML